MLRDNVLCKSCLGCNRLEYDWFQGVQQCDNYFDGMKTLESKVIQQVKDTLYKQIKMNREVQ